MNGNDTFLDINNAHLRVNSGNVQASTFVLDQINIVTSANTASTVNFNNVTKAFNAASNIEVGTANLFVDTTTSNVGIGTDAPAYTLDVHGTANVEILQTTSNIVMNGGTFSLGGHMIPTAHEQYDIGTAEKKIRHLFLSDNSLWLGDETNITFSGGKMKFRRRKKNILPRGLVNIGVAAGHANETATLNAALAYANKPIADMKLEHWLGYAKTLDPTKDISDVFTQDATGYEATSASEAFKEIGDDIFSSHNVAIGKSTAPTSALDVVGTVKATAFEGDGSALTGISGGGQWTESSGNIYRSSGNVGIGTTSADTKLHLYATGSGNVLDFKMSGSWSAGDYYRIIGYNTAKQIQFNYNDGMWLSDNNSIRFGCGGTPGTSGLYSERMRITNSGHVGVGTVSPDEKLHVNGNIRLGGPQGTDEDASYYIKSAGQIHINSAADGTADDSYICLDLTAGQANNNRSRIGICGAATNASYQHISFDTKDTERMRITNGGDLRVTGTNTYVQINNGGSIWRNYNSTAGAGLHFTGGAVIPADQNGGNHTSAHTLLGTSLYKWGQIWSTSSTISTSDRNEKQDINEITESERKVASKIVDLFRTFRMKDAVSKKGDEARLHNGVIAQDLIEVFQSEGLDAHRYGLFCYDDIWLVDGENELYETVYEKDDSEDGGLKEIKVKTGIFADKDTPGAVATPGPYSIRYEELLCFVVAGELQNERIKYSALEARITALENNLNT